MTKATDADLQRLTNLISTQQDTIDYLVQYIERVEAQLNDRINTVEVASRPTNTKTTSTGSPVDWSKLRGAARSAEWERLCAFVDRLVERNGLDRYVKPCWYKHSAAVEQLTGLWGAHREAFAPDADASMPIWWQDLLDRCAPRFRRIFVKCRIEHPAGAPGQWLTDAHRAERAEWIRRDEGAGAGQTTIDANSPVDWPTLHGDRRTAMWRTLCEFVDELVDRHSLEQFVRPCWYRHPMAVEELTALWSARQNAYSAPSDASMPSWWHDVLWAAQQRLRQVFVKCRADHDPVPGTDWSDTHEDRDAWIATEVAEYRR
jgi:hypothetical protein